MVKITTLTKWESIKLLLTQYVRFIISKNTTTLPPWKGNTVTTGLIGHGLKCTPKQRVSEWVHDNNDLKHWNQNYEN